MKIPDEKFAHVVEKIKGKVPSLPPCPVCHSPNWTLNSEIFEFPPFVKGGVIGSPVFPAALLICPICGYTLLFSAIALGLITPEKGEPNFE